MKNSLAIVAILFCGVVKAQTGFVEFPYNPDSDGDDFIGITDLLSLLSLYESEFSEEGLYLTSDSTEALYYTGNMNYPQCYKSCHDLPGKWWIPSYEEMLGFDHSAQSELIDGWAWIKNFIQGREPFNNYDQNGRQRAISVGPNAGYLTSQTDAGHPNTICLCYTRERQRAEYSICQGAYAGDPFFLICAESKSTDGWYALGNVAVGPNNQITQAFWRWKE